MKIFDVHHHVGTLRELGEKKESEGNDLIADDYKHRSKKMKKHGISQACLLPANSYSMINGIEDTKKINSMIAEYRNRYPEMFPVAMGIVELSHGERSLTEIDRIHYDLKLDGVVFHHRFQGGSINDPVMWPILNRIKKHGLKVFIHIIAESTLESPWKLEELADDFPEITFVALNAFSSPNQANWMTYLAKKHSNIIFETGVMISVGHYLKKFIDTHGVDRLIFGSDCYVNPDSYGYPFPLIELQELGLSKEDLNKVFYLNAIKYFGLEINNKT